MSSSIKNLKALAIAGVAGVAMAVGASAPAQATIWNITGILGPGATDGSFGYSSMHDSSSGSVRSGPTLAHFGGAVADNPGAAFPPTGTDAGSGQYDDVTGYFQASWTIFDATGAGGTTPGGAVGTIEAEGFLPDAVAGPGPSIGGSLAITVIPTAASTLATYMVANGMSATTTYWFQDLVEMATPSGFDPNTFKPDADPTNRVMTLWGATSSVANSGGTNPFTSSLIGTDVRFGLEESGGGTNIPEPATLGLFGLGLAGLGIATRRRRTR